MVGPEEGTLPRRPPPYLSVKLVGLGGRTNRHKLRDNRAQLPQRKLPIFFVGPSVDGNIPLTATGILAIRSDTAKHSSIRRRRNTRFGSFGIPHCPARPSPCSNCLLPAQTDHRAIRSNILRPRAPSMASSRDLVKGLAQFLIFKHLIQNILCANNNWRSYPLQPVILSIGVKPEKRPGHTGISPLYYRL
jgi:hypothetical protein